MLLEPVMRVEVVVPKDYMGDVMGNLASRRGSSRRKIAAVRRSSGRACPFGNVRLRDRPPLAHAGPRHLLDALSRYEEVPRSVAEEIIARVQGKTVSR